MIQCTWVVGDLYYTHKLRGESFGVGLRLGIHIAIIQQAGVVAVVA